LASLQLPKIGIPLSSLKDGVAVFHFQTVFPELPSDVGCRLKDAVEVDVQLTRMGDDYLVATTVKGEGDFICDRCGEAFLQTMEGCVDTLYTFDRTKVEDKESRETVLLEPSEVEIDIARDAQEALILAIPTKRLCQEGCCGLCPRCGANLNEASCSCETEQTDPRWNGLRRLTFDD
jgi:uncharacterized protein